MKLSIKCYNRCQLHYCNALFWVLYPGLDAEIVDMLYLCDAAASSNTILYVTFLLRKSGDLYTWKSVYDIVSHT